MYWITYEKDGTQKVGALTPNRKTVLTLKELGFEEELSMVELIGKADADALEKAERIWEKAEGGMAVEEVKLLSPIPRPIHDVICVGLNYYSHREETEDRHEFSAKNLQDTVYFSKRACRITGPDEGFEGRVDIDEELDYEVELAVIIGKECKDIQPEEAEEYIFGYSVFNDFSSRAVQRRHTQWLRGKSMDGYTAMGPVIVGKKQLPLPLELNLSSKINGELRQNSNTNLMMADIPTIVSELSQGMTLEPGDIIATGTPAGVGMGFKPPKYLKKGDCVECTIEGIGTLTNWIK